MSRTRITNRENLSERSAARSRAVRRPRESSNERRQRSERSMSEQSAYKDLKPANQSAKSVDVDSDKVMSIVDHLDELRGRLLRSSAYVVTGMLISLLFCKRILRLLELPAGSITFQALSLEEPLLVFVKVAFYSGLVIASPFVLFEISRFVSPGLTKRERKIMTPIVIGSPLLFCLGAGFAYFALLPSMLHFFSTFGQGVTPINQRLDFYISLVSSILLYMGLCFQLPIVIFALSFTGIINSARLLSIWKYAVFAASIVAAVITPDPTAFSMILVMVALTTLYFASILLLKLFGR